MLKKIILAVALAIPFFGASAQSTLKIGLVDTNSLIQAMPERAAAETKLADASKKYEAEYQKLGEEFKRLYDEFQAMDDSVLPAIKERKTRDLADYQQKMETFQNNAQQDLAKIQQELMAPMVQKIQQAIEAVGKEGGFSLIQEMASQLTFYHAAPVQDITATVKAKLGLK